MDILVRTATRRAAALKAVSAAILGAAVVAGAALPKAANAEPVVLRLGSGVPDVSPVTKAALTPWAEMVNKEAEGEFKIEVVNGVAIANPSTMWDRVEQGVLDMGWSLQGATARPFPKSNVASLPLVVEDLERDSGALWSLYEKGLIAGEYKGVKVLALPVLPIQGISARKPVEKLEDLSGLKLRVVDKVAADAVTALGASPISVPAQEVYQALSRGVVDGAVANWIIIGIFKVGEVAKHHQQGIPLGSAPGFIIMNEKSYEKLSPKGKELLKKATGEKASRFLGAAFARMAEAVKKANLASGDQKVYALSPEERKRWQEKLNTVVVNWEKDTPDGAKILSTFRAYAEGKK